MAMIAFLPWASIESERQFGSFRVTPYGAALAGREIPASASPGIEAILTGYGHDRPVDRAHVPFVRGEGAGFLDDLNDDAIEAYFAFRTQLAFAALSARDYFGLKYWNSDSLRMDIRSFSEDSTGAVRIDRRRRDGYARILYSADTFRERRPDYVPTCALDRDVDASLLTAFAGAADDGTCRAALSESSAVFVRANTDSPSVDAQSELIDSIGSISRLVDEWEAKRAIPAVIDLLGRAAWDERPPTVGSVPTPKTDDPRVVKASAEGHRLRAVWLNDAFRLRHRYAHGRPDRQQAPPIWTVTEHLLLMAWILPIAVKAKLALHGHYQLTSQDRFRNWVFDTLLAIAPFQGVPFRAGDGEIEERSAWRVVIMDAEMRFAGEQIRRSWDGGAVA